MNRRSVIAFVRRNVVPFIWGYWACLIPLGLFDDHPSKADGDERQCEERKANPAKQITRCLYWTERSTDAGSDFRVSRSFNGGLFGASGYKDTDESTCRNDVANPSCWLGDAQTDSRALMRRSEHRSESGANAARDFQQVHQIHFAPLIGG